VVEMLDPSMFSLVGVSPQPLIEEELLRAFSSVIWHIPDLEPGGTEVLVFNAVLNPSVPVGDEVVAGPVCSGRAALESFSSCLREVASTAVGCAGCIQPCAGLRACSLGPAVCVLPLSLCTACLVQADPTSPFGCIGAIHELVSCVGERLGELGEACAEDRQIAVAPLDPNEKLVLAPRFIRPDQPLVYPIFFENIGNAEALDVFITDVLDPALDLATLEILTPGAELDPVTHTLRWALRGRNLQPGETGNVLFLVRPLPGLPSGTEIRNRAEIQFEIFDSLITPDVVNIIDTSTPKCKVETLPETVFSDRFQVRWQGRDEVGEIESFSVFVTEDGGETFDLLQQTTAEETVFEGPLGGSYGFFCVAKDTVGNAETQALVAEATTRIARAEIDVKPDSPDNRVNSASRGVVTVALLGSEALDVTRVVAGSLSFGRGEALLAHRNGPHLEDVNGDRFIDLIAHFRIADTGIVAGDTEACLTGEISGARFEACDSITMTPAP
jgi:uncharacterized repeat protein (TIGR01451 family)